MLQKVMTITEMLNRHTFSTMLKSRNFSLILLILVFLLTSSPSSTYPASDQEELQDVQPWEIQDSYREYRDDGDVLAPPPRPRIFESKESVKAYLRKLNDYFTIIGRPRFG
ncbi:unnamed protein product [Calicophoron daubneyi]|uniref:Uncharacterized protein n=1 Tax=Calicophoron daubneyi TaxID=300641 RepID=A0AAV2TX24_CALDB